MEENTNMAEQTQNMGNETEVQGADQAAAGSGKDQKLFTQEEVNSFVQSRVSRLKGQISKEAQAEYSQKLAELQAREMKPRELADIITCADEKDLANKLDALQKIYGDKAKEEKPKGFICVGGRPYEGNTRGGLPSMGDPIRNAMGLN